MRPFGLTGTGLPNISGAEGAPVNCCTMARKLLVSVFSRVVGVLLEARERRLMGFETPPSGLSLAGAAVVVTVVASETEEGNWFC